MSVILYGTKECPYSKEVREFLRSKNIAFEDLDISQDVEARRELMEKSGMVFPAVEIEGTMYVGYSRVEKQLN